MGGGDRVGRGGDYGLDGGIGVWVDEPFQISIPSLRWPALACSIKFDVLAY